jgi:uncharacterized membrane protein/YHS domain-containing protein
MHSTQRRTQHPLLRTFALLLAGVVFLAVAAPALASEAGDSEGSWGKFLGRMHVVVLHLPIGLLVGAFAIEFFGLFKRSKGFDIAAAWLFVLGAITAVVAVITGLLLGVEAAGGDLTAWSILWADDDKVGETLNLHMWLGVGVMLFAIPAAVLKILAVRKQWVDESVVPARGGWPLGVARLGLISTMLLIPSVGHLGGNMVHTQDYLTEHAPAESIKAAINMLNLGTTQKPDVPENVGDSKLPDGTVAAWVNVIQPKLNDSCVKCHGPDSQKADIRLDSLKYAVESDGIEYPVITEEDAQFSALYVVITLPKSHEMFMPPDPKDAFDYETIEFIGEWIQNYDGRLEDPQPVEPATGDDGTPEGPKPVIAPEALSAITAAGGNAQSLSQEENPDELTVKFAYLKELDPAVVAKLESGADNIAWLTFEGSAFGDDAAKALPDMKALTKLNLKDSAITDAGLAELPEMPALTWLNLFGTEVSDAGLDALKKFGTLEKLYLTGTKVTADGVKALREAMPETEIFSDHDGQFQFTPVTPEVKPGDPAKDDKAAAKTVNDKCPVSGAPVKAGFVSTFEGKTVGFCCNNCKGKFDADPKKFAAKLQ